MKVYKCELTIPVEQYGNIRPTIEGTAEEIVEAYREFSKLMKVQVGIPTKEFNKCLDEILQTGSLTDGANIYPAMSPSQQNVLQELKKSLKRLKYDSTGNEEKVSH